MTHVPTTAAAGTDETRGVGVPTCSQRCPRCGYDQSGAVATWAEACPLHGLCPECGYEFAWREIFNPDEKRLPRFVEHCRRRAVPVAAVRTLFWALIPGRFWTRVKLHHDVRKRRWVVWLVLVLLGWHGVNIALGTVSNWAIERGSAAREWNTYLRSPRYTGSIATLGPPEGVPLRAGHLVDAALGPWGTSWNLSRYAPSWNGARWSEIRWRLTLDQAALFLGVSSMLLMPLVMMVMPQTRRRYKVQGVHLGRAVVFGMSFLALPLAIRTYNDLAGTAYALNAMRPVSWLPGMVQTSTAGFGTLLLLTAWQVWWWFRVVGRGWGIPRPAGHAAALVTISMLTSVALLAAIDLPLVGRLFQPFGGFNAPWLPRFRDFHWYR